jgi:2-oxoglutarate dehydrogenase E2 component (dihydrolipoamide succinyltransferase)
MEIKIPEVGESVFEALVAHWAKENGAVVHRDEPLCELETDKITFDISAEADGVLTILIPEGETVKIGTVIGSINEQAPLPAVSPITTSAEHSDMPVVMPAARKLAAENGIDVRSVSGSGKGGRVTVEDVTHVFEEHQPDKKAETPEEKVPPIAPATMKLSATAPEAGNRIRRIPMTPIRKRIAERLLMARQQTAMLTTFNEVDMSRVMELRSHYKESFQKKHSISLGFMSFFVKSCIEALREFPDVNASIDGNDLVYHDFYDIGIAIGAEKGLVVPVLRDADQLHFHEIEQHIAEYARKVKENRLAIADLEGGTFTISNGGVYGSLLSTPIINPPQSAVLGMHAIQSRPVDRDGQIVLRPMMYLALSYDHRIIDGRIAVLFLKRVCELVAEPEELFLEV